ncbi:MULTISPECIES: S1C family serine protease [Brevibacillus]|uniref:S1C family serine protease n=1 Tax=Brevibacillus TaxID=55080 RepID=UPI000373948F|nr:MULTISPECIES: trypsin-like peptidase domain-containing protein [Brevibacillus]ATO48697.1 serine protease [Brevibacillus laterosporus DSM 25]AYB41272.1 serine protease [Brevibacillus laterosporus]MBG9773309.1 serine protease [Brevibacillus laterosporus]MBG9798443.1 serine protease [Brevibacillus laterosporus]MBG9800889.1 serine protease [Brevibacillus laterosporus]
MKPRGWSYTNTKYQQMSNLHPFNFFVPLVEQVKHGVVSLICEDNTSPPDIDQILQSFLDMEPLEAGQTEKSFGSGFIFHPRGYILTSEHVIGKAKSIYVKMWNGKVFEAKLIFSDPQRDYAIVKIESDVRLSPLSLGNSGEARVGEWVISVGSPLGLENSVTAGIISAKNRRIQVSKRLYDEIFQTDAAINPGNSGGPLINLHGEVIGLNAFIIQSSQCLGFAIGIDSIKKKIQQLL